MYIYIIKNQDLGEQKLLQLERKSKSRGKIGSPNCSIRTFRGFEQL